jgi:tetratricopeptide (TPR) repeat protein
LSPKSRGNDMLNGSQVLAALSEWLSPGEIAGILQRILRVPESWQQLHDPAFLVRVREAQLPSPYSPSELGLLALGIADAQGAPLSPLHEELITKQQQVWHRALHAVPPDPDLEGVQLLALALVSKAGEVRGPERLASFVLSAPRTWRSPLACAWMHLPASTQTLAGLLSADQPQGIMLAANSLLANLAPDEAARMWLVAQPSPSAEVFLKLQNLGEPGLAAALADQIGSVERSDHESGRGDRLQDMLSLAARMHIEDDIQSAHDALDSAWSTAVKSTSIVAEQLAELARAEGDLVLALEARKQALSAEATPRRRAWLAMALLELGRTEDALRTLPKNLQCPEEQTAAGLVRLELGQRAQAREFMRDAVQASGEMEQHDTRWLDWLGEGLKESGDVGRALEIARMRLAAAPCYLNARIALSQLLAEAGDLTAAAQEAHLGFALAPESMDTRRALAKRLQDSDQAIAALAHWQALAESDSAYLVDLVACALNAGDIELAKQSAQAALRQYPDDAPIQVLYARTLVADGDTDGARSQLEQAIKTDPHNSEAWLALADCFAQLGDDQSQGSTLASAVQASPEDGSLLMSHALWLQSSGRLSEALGAAERAVEAEPHRVDWLIAYSELLEALGHEEQTLDVLQQAHNQQPANWQVRRRLAEVHEAHDDARTAWSYLGHIPDGQDAETHLMVGRIAVQAAVAGNEAALDHALTHLEQARALELEGPRLQYWLGVAYQLANRITEATQAYQACMTDASQGSDRHRRALIGLADCLIIEEQAEQAVTTLESALAQFPGDTALLVALSQALLVAGLAERSLIIAKQATDSNMESEQGLRQLVKSAEAAEQWDLALDAAGTLAQLKPQDPEAWLQLARLAARTEQVAQARSAIARAAALDRKNAVVLHQCADLLVDLGCLRVAQRMLQRAATVQPDDPSLLSTLANLAELNRDLETAQRSWTRISELEPQNSAPLYRAGQSLWSMNSPTEAIEHWHRALELDPGNADAHAALGRALVKNGEDDRGLKHLASAMELRPDDAQLALDTGRAAQQAGRSNEAVEILKRASRIAPEKIETAEALAKSLLELNRPAEAHEMLKRACIEGEAPPSTHALRAVAALHTGDALASDQALADAISIAPKNTQDASAFAQAALRLGRWSEAFQVSQQWAQESADPDAFLAHARLSLRIADAQWLYATASEARAHAPDAEYLEHASPDRFDALLEQSRQAGVSQADLELLQLRAAASLPGATEDSLAALDAQLSLRADGEIAEGLAIAHLRAKRPDQALQALRVHIPTGAGAGWTQILQGITLSHSGNHKQALQAVDLASEDPALRPLAQALRSLSMEAQGDLNSAIASLNAASSAWPEEATWHFRLAQLYAQQDDLDAAMPHYQQAAELDPASSHHILEFARALRDLGQSAAAAAAFVKVVKSVPEEGSTWREAGEAALACGDADRAQEWFERAVTISPSDAASLMGTARAYQALGNLREAQDRAQVALRIAPKDPGVLMGLGEILASRGQFEKAIRTYDQALNVATDPVAVQLRRSELLVKLGRAPQAVEQLIEIVQGRADDDRIWGALTFALEDAGDLESAMEAATRAVRLAPRNAAYRLALGRACRKSGHLDRAVEELTQAESIAPSEVGIAVEVGKAYFERRELPRALEAFQRAISLEPSLAHAHFGAAMVHKELKNYQEASDELSKALDLDPNDPETHHQLAAVRALALVHGGILQPME